MPIENLEEAIRTFDDDSNGVKVRARPRNLQKMIRQPHVVQQFIEGTPIAEIGRGLGIEEKYIYRAWKRALRSLPMQAMIERESRRILVHLPTRDLKKVPYEKLHAAACNAIRLIEDLDHAKKPAQEIADREFIRDLTVAIFGVAGARRREAIEIEARSVDASGIPEASPADAVGLPAAGAGDDSGSDPP